MDVYEIERHLRNQPDFLYIDGSLIDILIEKLKEVSYKYEQLTEVLDNWKDENKALQDELNQIKASA